MSQNEVKAAALELINKLGEVVTVANFDDSDDTDVRGYPKDRVVSEYAVKGVFDFSGSTPSGGSARFGLGGSAQDYELEVLLDSEFEGSDNVEGAGGQNPGSLVVRESGKTYTVRAFDDKGEGILVLGCNIQQKSVPDDVSLPSELEQSGGG